MGQLSLLSLEAEYESLFFSRLLDFRVGFMLTRDKPHLFPSYGCCMACHRQPCQLSLAVLAGRWANGPPLALMPFSLAVRAVADLHGSSSDLAVWKKQVTTGPTPGDLRHAH